MDKNKVKVYKRIKRKKRVRKKVYGDSQYPRLMVYRSSRQIYAQIIDDEGGLTLASASSVPENRIGQIKNGSNKEAAKLVGQRIAKEAQSVGIHQVRFDRNGYLFHGRVKELADAAREAGLKF